MTDVPDENILLSSWRYPSLLKESFDAIIIEAVEPYPVLYDHRDRLYRNNARRQEAWEEVHRNIKEKGFNVTSVEYCRKRFAYLRRRFIDEKGARAEGASETRKGAFPLYERMSFLHALDQPLPHVNSVDIELPGSSKDSRLLDGFSAPRKGGKRGPNEPNSFLKDMKRCRTFSTSRKLQWAEVSDVIGRMIEHLDEDAYADFSRKLLGHACSLLATSLLEDTTKGLVEGHNADAEDTDDWYCKSFFATQEAK